MRELAVCLYCGSRFERDRSTSKACSPRCKAKLKSWEPPQPTSDVVEKHRRTLARRLSRMPMDAPDRPMVAEALAKLEAKRDALRLARDKAWTQARALD